MILSYNDMLRGQVDGPNLNHCSSDAMGHQEEERSLQCKQGVESQIQVGKGLSTFPPVHHFPLERQWKEQFGPS